MQLATSAVEHVAQFLRLAELSAVAVVSKDWTTGGSKSSGYFHNLQQRSRSVADTLTRDKYGRKCNSLDPASARSWLKKIVLADKQANGMVGSSSVSPPEQLLGQSPDIRICVDLHIGENVVYSEAASVTPDNIELYLPSSIYPGMEDQYQITLNRPSDDLPQRVRRLPQSVPPGYHEFLYCMIRLIDLRGEVVSLRCQESSMNVLPAEATYGYSALLDFIWDLDAGREGDTVHNCFKLSVWVIEGRDGTDTCRLHLIWNPKRCNLLRRSGLLPRALRHLKRCIWRSTWPGRPHRRRSRSPSPI